MMYITNSGKQISKDSILAFVAENAIGPKSYAITNGYLAYNDHNMRVRTIDLDLIPSIDDMEERFAPPIVHKHKRHRVRYQRVIRKRIESLAIDCVLQNWACDKLIYEICKLSEEIRGGEYYGQND